MQPQSLGRRKLGVERGSDQGVRESESAGRVDKREYKTRVFGRSNCTQDLIGVKLGGARHDRDVELLPDDRRDREQSAGRFG